MYFGKSLSKFRINDLDCIFTSGTVSENAQTQQIFCLGLIMNHAKKTRGKVDIHRHALLASTLYRGVWSVWRPGRFIPMEISSVSLALKAMTTPSRSRRDGEIKNLLHVPGIES
jgi:hypothetical protein